jgi:hypothetical protein
MLCLDSTFNKKVKRDGDIAPQSQTILKNNLNPQALQASRADSQSAITLPSGIVHLPTSLMCEMS